MITVFELKHKACCRCFIRTPFYIKNFFLLCLLGLALLSIYVVYFRSDGMSIENLPRILKGLNSNTFNYLETHKEPLRLTKLLNNYPPQISTLTFMDDCLRINKPCKFEGLAKDWPASGKWNFQFLFGAIKEAVTVYADMQNNNLRNVNTGGNSFKTSSKMKMTYQEFLTKLKESEFGIVMREDSDFIYEALKDDIINPEFINNVSPIKTFILE